jgi:hypothetical protein
MQKLDKMLALLFYALNCWQKVNTVLMVGVQLSPSAGRQKKEAKKKKEASGLPRHAPYQMGLCILNMTAPDA